MINEFADIVKDIQPDANHQNINIFGSSNFALNRDSNSKKFSTKEDRYSNIQRSMSSHQSVIEDKNSLMSKENKSKALSDNKDKSVQNFEKISSNNEQSIQNLSDHNMNVNNNEVTFNWEKEQDSTARLSKISKNKQSNEEIRSKALDMILRQSND